MKFRMHLFISTPILIASLLFWLVGKSHAADTTKDIDCSNPQGQVEIGICQALKAEKAEKEMKIVYEKVANTMQGGCKELFETYQKAWQQYIAAKCLFDNCGYGSMFGQMVGKCEEENYRKRIEELKQISRKNEQ